MKCSSFRKSFIYTKIIHDNLRGVIPIPEVVQTMSVVYTDFLAKKESIFVCVVDWVIIFVMILFNQSNLSHIVGAATAGIYNDLITSTAVYAVLTKLSSFLSCMLCAW